MKNIFNNIYDVKRVANFKKVDFGSKEKIHSQRIIENNISFEEVLNKTRLNQKEMLTESDQQGVTNYFLDLKVEAKDTLKEVLEYKTKLLSDIKQSKTNHIFYIDKDPVLKKYALEVFQEEKDFLTLDDYFILLELKKQLEVDEFINYKAEM